MKDKTGTALWRTRQKASPLIKHHFKDLEAKRNTEDLRPTRQNTPKVSPATRANMKSRQKNHSRFF